MLNKKTGNEVWQNVNIVKPTYERIYSSVFDGNNYFYHSIIRKFVSFEHILIVFVFLSVNFAMVITVSKKVPTQLHKEH